MRLTVNGKPFDIEAGITVQDLLARLDLPDHRLAVAVNGEVTLRVEHAGRILQEGDEIEVIHAVAGG